jgi:2,3-bisphosphoglycerate-independent phosphoglycerate mutase
MSKKAMLIIMDGWGKGQDLKADAIRSAQPEFVNSLYARYPNAELITCGEAVGLPDGQMGNSEVGHLNLGAGRIVYQELQRVNVAIKQHTLANNKALQDTFTYAVDHEKTLHFIGLCSDGGVHAHINHLEALCIYAKNAGVKKIAIHAFTDGRDCDPKSGLDFIKQLQFFCTTHNIVLASICGRYFAMDRDKRWERVSKAYQAMVHGVGTPSYNLEESIVQSYVNGVTDEFIEPIIHVDAFGAPQATIQPNDAVICFNFRTDRCREITEALTQEDFEAFNMQKMPLYYTTLTEYDKTYENVHVVFNTDNLNNTLGEVLEKNNKTQLRVAETEKYPHVTFFFSGGRENNFVGERRIMKDSPKEVPTYDLRPEMSAYLLKDAVIEDIQNNQPDFICMNFANADMVGHTGVWDAVVQAVKTVDECVKEIIPVALQNGYGVFLTADHGNSDYMVNEDGSPNTQHSLNPVPLFLISNDYKGTIKDGKLGDIAPTILAYMGIPKPQEMTGDILIEQ